MSFGELFDAVQPAGRAAVKSALVWGRQKGDYTLSSDGKYAIAKKKARTGAAGTGSVTDDGED